MDIILLAGLWLPQSIWAEVAAELERLGHRPLPIALPGVDDGSTEATLSDQVDAVLSVIDQTERPVVVGHSAASNLAWIVADRRPEAVEKVIMIGGFPSPDGEIYADFFPVENGVMAFPGWAPFEGADADDLDEDARQRIASVTVPVPEGVSRGVVQLADRRRFEVPIVLVCPEFSPEDARGWIQSGEVPELAAANQVSFADIDSGHWPMITQSAELARIIDAAAAGA